MRLDDLLLGGIITMPWFVSGASCVAGVALGVTKGYGHATGAPVPSDISLIATPLLGAGVAMIAYNARPAMLEGSWTPTTEGFSSTALLTLAGEAVGYLGGYTIGRLTS